MLIQTDMDEIIANLHGENNVTYGDIKLQSVLNMFGNDYFNFLIKTFLINF